MMAAGSMRGYTILEPPPFATLRTDIFAQDIAIYVSKLQVAVRLMSSCRC